MQIGLTNSEIYEKIGKRQVMIQKESKAPFQAPSKTKAPSKPRTKKQKV